MSRTGRREQETLEGQGPDSHAGSGDPQAGGVARLGTLLNHPLSTYYLIFGATLLLLVLGLVMVLSASSIESYRVHGSPYTLAQRQALFAVLGVIGMFFAARTSVQFWRGLALPILGAAFVLLVAVLVTSVWTWHGTRMPP